MTRHTGSIPTTHGRNTSPRQQRMARQEKDAAHTPALRSADPAAATEAIADALGIPINDVSISQYSHHHPADLFTVTHLTAGHTESWRFVHNTTATRDTAWWLLGECEGCGATDVPIATITTRDDLDRYLAGDTELQLTFWQRDDGYCDCALP